MDQAEASGRTVDDALNRALAHIGATRADVEEERVQFDVLDEGRKGGLFGRGAKEAVVRVQRVAQPAGAAPAVERAAAPNTRIPRGGQDRPQGRSSEGGGRRGRGGGRSGGRDGGENRPTGRSRFERPAPTLTEADFLRAPTYNDQEEEPAPAATQRRDNSHGRDRERRRREETPEVTPDINAEDVDFAATVVDDLLRLLDINADITIREPQTPGDGLGTVRAVIDISGEDLGLLIGRRGDTLLSLQYLVNLITSTRHPGKGGVTVDVEHYRHRREEQVVSLAQRMADRVRQTGSPITLEPMSAAERRLVHLALADDPELATNSVGEGENRKVVISTRR
jgi:spoIIIJ-associated protein